MVDGQIREEGGEQARLAGRTSARMSPCARRRHSPGMYAAPWHTGMAKNILLLYSSLLSYKQMPFLHGDKSSDTIVHRWLNSDLEMRHIYIGKELERSRGRE